MLYPVAAVPIQRIGRRVRRASGGMQEQIGDTATLLNESFAQARTVRVYRLEQSEEERAKHSFDLLHRSFLRISRGRARVDPVLEVLGGAAVAAVLGFAGWRAATGGATLGNFSGFVAALLLASRPLRALGSLNAALQEGLAGLVRIFGVIDEPPDVSEAPHAGPLPRGRGHLRFENVSFVYPDGREGLRGLDFEAEPGLTVALVGPSGAGKSTALSLIPRLHDVSGGRILLDGVDLRDVRIAELRGAIAYVSQDTLLFDTSIAANIRMGRPQATDEQVRAAARAAAAEDFIDELPAGFETRVGTGASASRAASGSAWHLRVRCCAIPGCCCSTRPPVRSTPRARPPCRRAGAAAPGRTTIVVAHRLSTVRSADLVIALSDGRAAECGTHAELLELDGLYARLVRTQALQI